MPACAAPGVDLVRGCHEAEPQRLIRRAALKIVFERGVVLIAITGIPGCKWACPHNAWPDADAPPFSPGRATARLGSGLP
jgi:hypothetical protein